MIRFRIDNRQAVSLAVKRAGAEALNDAAEVLLEEANRTVPIEEGILSASGNVDEATPFSLTASVGYGGAASAYAVYQHERTDLRHDAGKTAKWLENAARDFALRFENWVGSAMRRRLS